MLYIDVGIYNRIGFFWVVNSVNNFRGVFFLNKKKPTKRHGKVSHANNYMERSPSAVYEEVRTSLIYRIGEEAS